MSDQKAVSDNDDPTDEDVEREVDATYNELLSMNIPGLEANSHFIRTAARLTAYRLLKYGKARQ